MAKQVEKAKKVKAFKPEKKKKSDKKEKTQATKKKKKSQANCNAWKIRNKEKRQEILFKRSRELKKIKRQQRKKSKEEQKLYNKPPDKMPQTIEDKREIDETFVFEEDSEILNEEKYDEFSEQFDSKKTPKILLTTSERPSRQLFDLLKEVHSMFPNCEYQPRQNQTIQEIAKQAIKREFTSIMVWRESRKKTDELILINLPEGPTAIFKVTNIKLNMQIFHHGNPTDHFPELVLNNFNTMIGRRVARFFVSLFPQNPEFKGRQVVTFHDQRDFLFVRRHRQIFDDEGNRVKLQEIGPRFTLKLKVLQKGIFDNYRGEAEFVGKPNMYVSRKKFYL